jgi:uroporphyrinogen-III decarboxylase
MNLEKRFAGLPEYLERSKGYYRLPMLIVNGFTSYTFLRGFENSMMDFALEPEKAGKLLDGIFEWEMELMGHCARLGFHGFHLGDDWGTQRSLIVSPKMWYELFMPRYKRQVEHAHRLGLDVWFHSCGNVTEIAEGLHECGVDVLNLAQPNTIDIAYVGSKLKGKQCFLIPISYQTTSISGSHEEILADARRMHGLLGDDRGGFIGYVEEYACMGMSDENYNSCIEAFRAIR